ncbi:MAG: 16S rRNA (cytosine(1402)-N(4))-methyltransferase, partial [Acidobacteria bacterium]|nr:16S rRNA (cytosine(1402)-N(4))-methyltransferase [Acidobacteriota bacterium]
RHLAQGEIDPVTGRPQSERRLIEILTRKPVRPTGAELAVNPRSRSARLRAAKRL